MASGPEIGRIAVDDLDIATASSVSLGMNNPGVQPLQRMWLECRMSGCRGYRRLFRDCAVPLANSCASSGSQTTIYRFGTLLGKHQRRRPL